MPRRDVHGGKPPPAKGRWCEVGDIFYKFPLCLLAYKPSIRVDTQESRTRRIIDYCIVARGMEIQKQFSSDQIATTIASIPQEKRPIKADCTKDDYEKVQLGQWAFGVIGGRVDNTMIHHNELSEYAAKFERETFSMLMCSRIWNDTAIRSCWTLTGPRDPTSKIECLEPSKHGPPSNRKGPGGGDETHRTRKGIPGGQYTS